jgi:endoglucanase
MANPTRRNVLSLSVFAIVGRDQNMHGPEPSAIQLVGASFKKAPASHLEPWSGVSFSARCGVNVVPLGFEIYQPVTIENWDKTVTDARLAYLRQAGFDHVRIAFDPTPALAAASPFALAAVLAVAKHAIEATLRAGLMVILDLHVAVTGPWGTDAVEADYPAGAKWRRYTEIARAFGVLCAGYPTSAVAFELYNENSNNESYGNTDWSRRVQDLWTSVRSVNVKTTLLVGGSFYSSIDGLKDLQASHYDKNTGFVVHNYNPAIFTHQNAASYTRFVERLHYPPIASDKAAAIAGMERRVNASDGTEADKKRLYRDRVSRLDAYFDTPQGPDYVAAKLQEVVRWQAHNGVPSSRIFVTEFGTHNDHDFPGGSLIARMAWIQDVDRGNEAAGFSRTIWNYNSPDYWDITAEDGSWKIRDGFLVALGRTKLEQYEPEAVALFAKMPTRAGLGVKALMSETIRQLKENGLWAKLDGFYSFASEDFEAGQIDWKSGDVSAADESQLRLVRNEGVANKAGQAGVIGLGQGGREGHLGLVVNAVGEARQIELGSEASAIRLDGATLSTKGAGQTPLQFHDSRTGAEEEHLIVSRTMDNALSLYIGGSMQSTEPSEGAPAEHQPPVPIRLSFDPANQVPCSIAHFGAGLTSDDAKNLYTIARFYLNGLRRQAPS